MSEKSYEFRELTASDIFPMCRIIRKIGVKDIKTCFDNQDLVGVAKGDENATIELGISIGFDVAELLIQKIPTCEDEVFDFLASVSNMSVKEIKKMGIADFAAMIFDFTNKSEFGDFIKVASKFINREK